MHIFQIFHCKTLSKLPDLSILNFRVRIVNAETLGGSLLSTENGIYRNEGPELYVGILEYALVLMRQNSLHISAHSWTVNLTVRMYMSTKNSNCNIWFQGDLSWKWYLQMVFFILFSRSWNPFVSLSVFPPTPQPHQMFEYSSCKYLWQLTPKDTN